jgi:probable O-glycosylation ligase (exosortase A-associated)
MMIPMMRYLQLQATKRWIRLGLTGAMLTSGVSIVGTYSRGALLAVVAMGFVFWMKSRRRLVLGIVGAIAVFAAVAATPTKWFDRMNTIETYEEDKSAMDRIEIWTHMYRIALDRPIVGGGFEIATDTSFYAKYRTDLTWGRSPHSAYFEVLGEHGFVGLAIYLGLGIGMWLSAGRLIRRNRKSPEHRCAADLGGMIQVALVGYAVGAAFINKAYYEPFFHLAAILIVVHAIVARDRHEATGPEYWRGPARQAGTMERPGRTRSLPQA